MRTLAHVMAHVRAQNRPGSHGAVLLREIERLRAWISTMSAEHPSMSRVALAGEPSPTQETANV